MVCEHEMKTLQITKKETNAHLFKINFIDEMIKDKNIFKPIEWNWMLRAK